ncbi:unannotated protein [freshwater metagenome]|uniref:Unannotated protein n=1 Tax=freshwater metagenome TaxID=449393 RepID=A0A6J7HRA3_9ZZZZ
MYARGFDSDVIEQRCACGGFVALGITGWQVALIAPPELDSGPVDRIAPWLERHGGEYRGADAPAGEDDARNARRRLSLDDARREDPCDRQCQRLRIGMTKDLAVGHPGVGREARVLA